MRAPFRKQQPQAPKAKNPSECGPLTTEQFSGAIIYVAKAFLSAAIVPQEFFKGVAIPEDNCMSTDAGQRTTLAAYAHFKSDINLTLNFIMRYRALLILRTKADLSRWIVSEPGSEYAVFSEELLGVAAKHKMTKEGQFDVANFLAELERVSVHMQAIQAPVLVDQIDVSHAEPEKMAA